MGTLSREAAPVLAARQSFWDENYRLLLVVKQTLTYAILLIVAAIMAFPLAWILITSVKNQREVFGTFLPKSLDFSNYSRVWQAMELPQHLLNSLLVCGITVGLVVLTVTLAGYAFARLEFPAREPIFYIFLIALMIPGQSLLIPMFIFLRDIGLLNSLPGLAFSFLGGAVPFATFLMRAFFKSLPSELGDAGKIDGCTEFGVFRHIYMPLARPGVATILIFQFVGTWNEFQFSTTFISNPDLKTIQPALYQAIGRYATDYTALSSGLVLALIPIITVYLLLQSQFIKGLTAGALRG
jgi:ABC-type glycerol-3-phosphate transport system permease component